MPSLIPATTLRLTDEDRAVLRELKDVTGLSSTSDVVRLALREMLSVRLAQAAVQQGRVRRGRR